jgi:endonuclease/exonuclease/phosphatase family metal-dependent hydrolase
MNLLFWNINKKPLVNEIKSLCDCYDVDILILAENEIQDKDILPILNENTNRVFIAPSHSKKISLYTRFHTFKSVHDDNYWGSIRKITHPSGIDLLLVAVHIPSKLYKTETEQALFVTRIANEIDKREQEQGHTRTIVIGDFNMNPFESGLINAEAFHAVMDKQIASKNQTRKVLGVERKFFYNPMWSRLGDDSEGSAGTYYYPNSDYFWNTFDQVLLRPSLLRCFKKNNLKVIDKINETSLIKNGKVSNQFSDHLPLLIKLEIENTRNKSND